MENVENGVAVYGSEGMVQIGRWAGKGGFKVFDRQGKEVLFDNANEPDTHARNFIDCIRSRQRPNADIEVGHVSTTYAHLANIVARTGRSLKFDARSETIAGDAEAARYLKRQYRKHWATPRDAARTA
jgi:Oxidoreductase family, C-terminal alpha/beta domain